VNKSSTVKSGIELTQALLFIFGYAVKNSWPVVMEKDTPPSTANSTTPQRGRSKTDGALSSSNSAMLSELPYKLVLPPFEWILP
jgi:hypothetical protein